VSKGGNAILQTADVNGIRIGGLIFDAGTTNSSVLVQVGPSGSSASHASDPTVLSDVFARIGGATVGKDTRRCRSQRNVLVGDDLWLWRATTATAGRSAGHQPAPTPGRQRANVTMYGLASRLQAVQSSGTATRSRLLLPERDAYDPPSQSAWMDGSPTAIRPSPWPPA